MWDTKVTQQNWHLRTPSHTNLLQLWFTMIHKKPICITPLLDPSTGKGIFSGSNRQNWGVPSSSQSRGTQGSSPHAPNMISIAMQHSIAEHHAILPLGQGGGGFAVDIVRFSIDFLSVIIDATVYFICIVMSHSLMARCCVLCFKTVPQFWFKLMTDSGLLVVHRTPPLDTW